MLYLYIETDFCQSFAVRKLLALKLLTDSVNIEKKTDTNMI